MSAPLIEKSTKKRKAKGDTSAAVETASHSSDPVAANTNGNDSNESPYMKELSKQLRNLNKKITASAKADAVLAENPGKSLDELVASRKLNTDQKAQIEKKPAIKAQIAQIEEQVTQYRTLSSELEERFAREKASLVESHEAEIAQLKEEAAANTKASESKDLEDSLKVVSYFLNTAAAKRQSEEPDSDEARAFEGALLLVYQGNDSALSTLRNLITGADEKITDTQGELVDYTYAQIKEAALNQPQPEAEQEVDAPPAYEAAATDPTIAHAGLTELQDTEAIPIRTQNGEVEAEAGPETQAAPEQASTGDDAANAVAESKWDPEASVHTEASAGGEGWVNVPRDPAETDNGLEATPAAWAAQPGQTNNWADEVAATPAVPENDGFEQVQGRHRHVEQRGRGRGRGYQGAGFRGPFRGAGGRGGPRGDSRGGRGGRGDGRGGRGGNRGGDRGPERG